LRHLSTEQERLRGPLLSRYWPSRLEAFRTPRLTALNKAEQHLMIGLYDAGFRWSAPYLFMIYLIPRKGGGGTSNHADGCPGSC